MFALIKNGVVVKYPYSLRELKREHPDKSFGVNMSDQGLQEFGLFRVYNNPRPEESGITVVEESTPVFSQENGRWEQVWTVRNKSAEEIAEQDAAQAAAVRAERNTKLSASDWTQVADAPVDQAAWAVYRQALRSISAQEGFPWAVTWPSQPA